MNLTTIKDRISQRKAAETRMKNAVSQAFADYCAAHAANTAKYRKEVADECDAEAWEAYRAAAQSARDAGVESMARAVGAMVADVEKEYARAPTNAALSMIQALSMRRDATPAEFESAARACDGNPAALMALRGMAESPEKLKNVPSVPNLDEFRAEAAKLKASRERRISMYLNITRAEADACGGNTARLPVEFGAFTPGSSRMTFDAMLNDLEALGM